MLICIGFTSCKKDDDYQPKGDYQPAGDYVVSGNNNNTINVYNITVDSWILSDDSYSFYNVYQLPTNANLNGVVMVYEQDEDKTVCFALPYTINDAAWSFGYSSETNKIEFILRSASGSTSFNTPSTMYYKVVVIPPGIAAVNPTLDLKNYAEVKKNFNLK
jgi:hypothetical protein